MKIKNSFLFSALLACVCVFFARAAYAVDLDKYRIELLAQARANVQETLAIKNTDSRDVTVTLSAGEYRYIADENVKGAAPRLASCASWISFDRAPLAIASGETKNIPLTITIPADARGEYVASIAVEEEKTPEENKNFSVIIVPRIVIPVYVTIGPAQASCEIKDIAVTNADADIWKIGLTVKNTGPTHLRLKGSLTLIDAQKKPVGIKNIPVSLPVFPGQEVTLPVYWKLEAKGSYTLVATLEMPDGKLVQNKKDIRL